MAEEPAFSAVRRSESTVTIIEQEIKNMILSGRLTAGSALPPERQLAERFTVSRTPLREALQSLTRQGVLQVRQGSGWRVVPSQDVIVENLEVYLTLEDISLEQLTEARSHIEPEIAAFTAMRRDEEQLRAIRNAYERSLTATTIEEYFAADSEYHAMIASACGNVLLTLAIRPLLGMIREVRFSIAASKDVVDDSHREHGEIFAAIETQDTDRARKAMFEHSQSFLRRAQRAVRENPELAATLGGTVSGN